ncbi:MAG: outer membrane protein, partial [Hyphomicrobiales bacterium]
MSSYVLRAAMYVAAFVASAAASFAANAADINTYKPAAGYDAPPPALSYWNGWYVGGVLGYAYTDMDFTAPAGNFNVEPDGVVGGGILGWSRQAGNYVFGVEADIVGADVDDTQAFGVNSVSASMEWLLGVRGRIGVLVSPQTQLFGMIGAGFAEFDLPVAGAGGGSRSETFSGLQFGAGMETAFNENWSRSE